MYKKIDKDEANFNYKSDWKYRLPFYIIGIIFVVIYAIATYNRFLNFSSQGAATNFGNIFYPFLIFLVVGLIILGYGRFCTINKNRKNVKLIKFILYFLAGVIIISSFFGNYSGEFAAFAIPLYWGIAIFLLIIAMFL